MNLFKFNNPKNTVINLDKVCYFNTSQDYRNIEGAETLICASITVYFSTKKEDSVHIGYYPAGKDDVIFRRNQDFNRLLEYSNK